MFYVYVLLSTVNRDVYVGFSTDLRVRFSEHNAGKVKSTKGYRPWKLIYYEAYASRQDATRREKQLKMHKAKLDLKQQVRYSLE